MSGTDKDTVDRILEATAVLADELGASGVRSRLVAERAGVGHGTLTYYFPTLRDLYEACLQRFYDEALKECLEHFACRKEGETSLQTVEGLLVRLYGLGRENRSIVQMRVYATFSEGEIRPIRRQNVGPALRVFAGLFPELSAAEARFAAHSLTHLLLRFITYPEHEIADLLGCNAEETAPKVLSHLRRTCGLLLRP